MNICYQIILFVNNIIFKIKFVSGIFNTFEILFPSICILVFQTKKQKMFQPTHFRSKICYIFAFYIIENIVSKSSLA